MNTLRADLRYAVRTLARTPGPALVAAVALALGIGLTTTMFSIIYGGIMQGLPYPGGDRIAVVMRSSQARGVQRSSLPIQDLYDYRAQQRSFTALGGYTSGTVNVSGTERAERFDGTWATADVFRALGVPPLLGRTFSPEEAAPGGAKVVVLGYDVWRERYASDPSILGRSLRVNGDPYTVIGVMPQGFDFPDGTTIWLPLQTDPLAGKRGEGQFLVGIGKLKPGVSFQEATADVAATARRLAVQYPEADSAFTATALTYPDWSIGPQPRHLLYTMLGAVIFVLLIACANVANLLLDRAAHRTREVGIRAALGATRAQVVRLFLTESSVLAFAGVALGVVLAWFGVHAFNRAIADTGVPSYIRIGLYPPVLLFALGAGLLASLASGVIPALQSSRTDVAEVLKDESRGSSGLHIGRLSRGLVMLEIALSCALLLAAGLMVKSVMRLRNMDPGFATASVFTARIGYPEAYTDTLRQKRFFRQLNERLATIPGVRAAAISSGLPGASQGLGGGRFAIDGKSYARPSDYPLTRTASVTPSFFATLQIPLARGRLLNDGDRDGTAPVAVVTQHFADRYLADGDALGRRIRFGGADSEEPWITIVGVVPDIFGGDPEDPRPPVVFRPLAQAHSNFVYISARAAGSPMALTAQIRDAAAALEPDLPLYWIMPLDRAIAKELWFVRVFGTMFMIFGAVALFLAAVGLYAVMSFSVSRRTREVGIRMALGARTGRVVRMILRQGIVQLAVGMTIGLALAIGISRLLAIILFDVQPRDPFVFIAVATTLALTGVLASFVPALRATRVQPQDALRSE